MQINGQRYEVVVIGAGQAGLAVSYHLLQRGVRHVVLERDRAGHEWSSRRWDSFSLVTPNWQCQLPGHPYRGADPDGFMVRTEIARYLDAYLAAIDFPLVEGTTVTALREGADGYQVETSRGLVEAEAVVVATGPYQMPVIPRLAERLPSDLRQLHSSQYRNPEDLPAGDVLVVGTGQSGCQIAEDLHLAGRQVHLATGSAPRVARLHRGRDVVAWLHDMGYYDRGVHEFDDRDAVRARANHYVTGRDGGHDLDLRAFAREGMCLYGRLIDLSASTVTTGDDLAANLDGADAVYNGINQTIDEWISAQSISAPSAAPYVPVWAPADDHVRTLDVARLGAVVWATGYRRDYGWIKVPVFDGTGYPTHERGVSSATGLYFIGLPWQHTWGSGRFSGVARDAQYLADQIVPDRVLVRG